MKVIGQKPIDRSLINRILVRATNWVGDMIMGLPALDAIRENFPRSRIVVLARPWVSPLLEGYPAVDGIIPLRKGEGYLNDWIEIIRVAGVIRRSKFDLALLFQNAFEAALISFLGGVRFRVGYDTDGRRFLLSHAIVRDAKIRKMHQVEYYLSILRTMGWEAESRDPVLSVGERDMEAVQMMLSAEEVAGDDLLLGLSPGAIFGPAKRWPPERFALLGDWAIERWGAKVVIMGSPKEEKICRRVAGFMKHSPINLCGKTTLRRVMALIKRCQFFVTNDSGLMHVAAALNVPTVAIFGSTDHVTTGPLSKEARIVRHEVDCAPCLKPECPTDYQCMLGIEPDDVWREMEILRGVGRVA